ncbi:hypothetical protein [Nocardia sp. CNY236]|uniref:hypothetical protein n=1 Tax=Nocardia sp. CNY236 TaxID=1169152 RepID=UPI00048BF316|nr:hypothetical protein [Nocardia sp. CNY236]
MLLPFFLAIGIIGLMMSLDGIAQGNSAQTSFGFTGALVTFAATPICVRVFNTRRRSLPQVRSAQTIEGETALLVPAWRGFSLVLITVLIAAIAFGVVYIGMLPSATQGTSDPIRAAISSFEFGGLALAVVLGSWLFAQTLTSLKRGKSLRLTQSGVHLNNGLMRQILDWDEILLVEASAEPRFATVRLQTVPGSVKVSDISRLARNRKRSWSVEIYTLEFDADSALVYHLVNFYWRHPEARKELASSDVVDRIRNGDLLV